MSASDVIKMIKDNDVKFVELRFTDTIGKEQHVTVPAHEASSSFFEDGKMFDGSSIAGWKGINESDISLASASGGLVIGFNVRAIPKAREQANRDGVDIRYYNIIYNVVDDVKALLEGKLSPTLKESHLGNAEIREVFSVSKIGKVAGCLITSGTVRRGAKVRLLRDSVVVYEGELAQLKRFKDDVREVQNGYECGMALENYNDIQTGDVIECFEVEEIARQLSVG